MTGCLLHVVVRMRRETGDGSRGPRSRASTRSFHWANGLLLWVAPNETRMEDDMSKWVPLLVRIEDYAELASQVAAREAKRPAEAAGTLETRVALAETPRAATKAEEWLTRLKPWSLEDLHQ